MAEEILKAVDEIARLMQAYDISKHLAEKTKELMNTGLVESEALEAAQGDA